MPELASNSIGAVPVFPKTIALPLSEAFGGVSSNELVRPMSESAFATVRTHAEFGEILAEFCFVFERVGLESVDGLVSLLDAVAFGGAAGGEITGFFVKFDVHVHRFLNYSMVTSRLNLHQTRISITDCQLK